MAVAMTWWRFCRGIKPGDLQFELTDMPLASDPTAFSYDDISNSAASQPFANGLIEGMLSMPVASASTK